MPLFAALFFAADFTAAFAFTGVFFAADFLAETFFTVFFVPAFFSAASLIIKDHSALIIVIQFGLLIFVLVAAQPGILSAFDLKNR